MKIFLVCLLAAFTSGCFGDKKEVRSDTLSMVTGAIRTLDSVKATDSQSFNILSNTQETLLVNNNNIPVAGAAKSFLVSKDGKTYTFKLRQGLKWSDGKPLTSHDFKYAWMRLLDPKVGAGYAFFLFGVENAKDYYLAKNSIKASDVGLYTPDDLTFVVKLVNPIPYFTQIATFTGLAPQRKDLVKKYKDKYATKPELMAFSGPFMVSEWVKGSKIILKKNPNYWDAKNIKLEGIKLMEIKEGSTAYQMFLNGQLDVLKATSAEYIEELDEGVKAKKWKIKEATSPTVYFIAFNTAKSKLLKSPKARLALSLATNRKAYVEKIIRSQSPAYALVPPGVKVGDIDYRKEVAQQLKGIADKDVKELLISALKEAKLDEDPSKYTLSFLLQNNTAKSKTQGEYLKEVWEEKLGIKVRLIFSADFSDFLQKLDRGKYDLSFQGWSADYDSPLTFLDLFTKDNGTNYGHYYNERVDKLVSKVASVQDDNARLAIFKEIEQIYLIGDPAISPLYYIQIKSYQKNFVQGLQLSLYGGEYQFRWASKKKAKSIK